LAKDKELTSAKPEDKTVKEWQDAVVAAQATVARLSATAQSLPGGGPGAVSALTLIYLSMLMPGYDRGR
jgi:hypothetical protein